ncbi:MAG: pantetheine-phosphate adenylyltransferase [Bacteroidota bacterium]|nr:pantetheine-phosphate adenylyltransferase [Bacteroidota bacterium]
MKTAVYPGSFDPITNGHLDVLDRATALFDTVIVTVAKNPAKQTLFSPEERIALIEEAVAGRRRVRVEAFDGLVVDFARQNGASALVRGLRAVSDFEFEFQMALMNRKLAPDIETVFLMPNEKYTYLNSSVIRELARLGTNIVEFVPPHVQRALEKKFAREKSG